MDNSLAKKKYKQEQKKLLFERKKHHKDVLKYASEQAKQPKNYDGDAFICLKNINKIYPNHVQAVYDFNLDIKENEFIVFVGPSGCGKSTTLRMIAGLEEITSGDLFINKEYSNELPPKDRGVTMVFQSYALYPHMSVYENMAFALKIQHFSKEEIDERIHKAAKILQIEEYLDRKPAALSGGQCQRVALGRAIVTDAKIFLMDEPLSNLDAKLRVQMRSEIVKLHNAVNATTIYVTHDQTEAMTMASRIVVMNKGVVQQIDTPEKIFNHPANLFVATFIGSPAMNVLNVKQNGNCLTFENGYEFILDKEAVKKIDSFYSNEIKRTDKSISDWKDEFLTRFKDGKKYKKTFDNHPIDKSLIVDLLKDFDDSEEVLTKIEVLDDELTKVEVDSYLKEALYKLETKDNPLIIKLEDTFKRLKEASESSERELKFGIRPEHIQFNENEDSIKLKVNLVELLGSEYYLHLDFATKEILAKADTDKKISKDDELSISFKKDAIHLFDVVTEKSIFFDNEEE